MGPARCSRSPDVCLTAASVRQQLTQEYYKWARKMCEAPILVAVKCREQEGMLAGFKCRDEHRVRG